VVPVNGVQAAEVILFAIWTSWLIIALVLLNESYGAALVILFAVAGLPLTLTGTVTWRLYLMIWLIIHVLASAVVTVREHMPEQVLAASVSLGGIVWLSILHPPSAERYFIGILLMILTVAALVLFEYGWWRAAAGMIKWRVDAAVAQANSDADRRLRAANKEKRDAEQRHKKTEAKSRGQMRVMTARQHELEAELSRVQQKLRQAHDNLPLVIERIPGRGPQPQAATNETDKVQVVVTTLELQRGTGPGGRTRLSSSPRDPSASGQATRMVVHRQVVTLSPEPGETAGHFIARAEDRLREELAATAAVSPAEKIGECILPAVQPWPAAAVDDGSEILRNIVIGKPVQEISSWAGASQPMSAALGRIADIAPITPVDAAFTAVKRVIQIGTIAWGALTANPLLVAAGVKAIGHDILVDKIEEGIERTLLDRGPAKGPKRPGRDEPSDQASLSRRTVRPAGPTAADELSRIASRLRSAPSRLPGAPLNHPGGGRGGRAPGA
jgi:hypothetical protein